MTLENYIKNLQEIVKENPDSANLLVIYAKDDEGNGYQEVHYSPAIGYYDEDGEFQGVEDGDGCEINSICIN